MTIVSRILSIILSICLLFLIFELVRRRRLKEKYAILWFFTGITILCIALFENMLSAMVNLLGIEIPINGVFFLGIFFLILINLHFSVVISNLNDQNKKIAQKLALLEAAIKSSGA